MKPANRKQKDNIIRNPRRYPVTFVSAVFLMILLYLIIQGIVSLTRHPVTAYNIGAPGTDNIAGTYTGMVLREEQVVTAGRDGYLCYYTTDGNRLSDKAVVLTIDRDGNIRKKIHEIYYGQEIISDSGKTEIKQALRKASGMFDAENFQTAIEAKALIESTVLTNLLRDGGEDLFSRLTGVSYDTMYLNGAGFVLLWRDGYEGLQAEDLQIRDFSGYDRDTGRVFMESGDRVSAGDFVYKKAEDNTFDLAFLLTDEEALEFGSRKNLSIRTEDGLEITGAFRVTETRDHGKMGVLHFQKYGSSFMSERYVSFHIVDKEVTGYKIPETALVYKQFYVVDEAFITEGQANGSKGLLVSTENGARFMPCTVYEKSTERNVANFIIGDGVSYVYSEDIVPGMTVIGETEDENGKKTQITGTVSVTAAVEGVYQINNGFCVFKPVVRLSDSIDSSYVMIASRVRYGLASYDRIVLNASEVSENEIVID